MSIVKGGCCTRLPIGIGIGGASRASWRQIIGAPNLRNRNCAMDFHFRDPLRNAIGNRSEFRPRQGQQERHNPRLRKHAETTQQPTTMRRATSEDNHQATTKYRCLG
jgi:hypothetical protein